jgi:hypothetical protein
MAFLAAEAAKGEKVYPPAPEVFSWSDACNLSDVKVTTCLHVLASHVPLMQNCSEILVDESWQCNRRCF